MDLRNSDFGGNILQIMSKRKKFQHWKKESFTHKETVNPWRHF